MSKHPTVAKPDYKIFQETLQQVCSAFLGLTHELVFTSFALRNYMLVVENEFKPENSLKLLTCLLDSFDYNYLPGEHKKFIADMIAENNLGEKYLLLNFAKAEYFLSKVFPEIEDDIFGLQFDYQEPEFWFGNLSFKDFVRFNTACFCELRRSRNDLVHNGGYVTSQYVNQRDNGLRKDAERNIDSSFKCLIQDFELLEPYKDISFIKKIKSRLVLNVGEKLSFDLDYIGFAQMVLIERIFLKSGIYHLLFDNEKKLHKIGDFDFWVFSKFPRNL